MSDPGHIGGVSDDEKVLVAEYALGLLSAAEHEAIGRRLAAEPPLAEELRLWRQRLASLDAQFVEATPPASALRRIEDRLFGTARIDPGGFWSSLAVWRGLTAAAAAVAVIAIGVNVLTPRPDANAMARELVAAIQAQGTANVSFLAVYDPAQGSLRLTSLSGDAVPDKDFELWAIKAGAAPQSMGVIPLNVRTELKPRPDILAGFGEGTVLAVTVEPKGGSPTGAPTGAIVAKGAATAI